MNELFDGADKKLLQKFKEFNRKNPDLYTTFRGYAHKIRSRGFKKYSAWTIINLIRWEHDLKTEGNPFKISNDFIALYARLLIYREPDFLGFFDLKPMKKNRKISKEERLRGEQNGK